MISLQNVDREHAFSDSDQQLLETLAGSLSVALENARLVQETRQRNAELALINSVQDAIAGELEPQAIYDAVGDRIRDVFDAQSVFISTLDQATGLVEFPYIIERGERLTAEPGPPAGVSKHVLETGESLLIGDVEANAEQYESKILAGEWPKSSVFVPLVTGGKATGVISLQNADRPHAFAESDRQLLETLAGSLSVALENARLVHETRQRNAELALINRVQDAHRGRARRPGDLRRCRGSHPGRLRRAGRIDRDRRRKRRRDPVPVFDRARRALAGRAAAACRLREACAGDAAAVADRRGRGSRVRAIRKHDRRRRATAVGPLHPARGGRQGRGCDLAPEHRP